jgi:hypothetical protein
MLDFAAVTRKETTLFELCGQLTPNQLRDMTNEMIDTILDMIAECTDEDVMFEYRDSQAEDKVAASSDEVNMSWTLGHVIVHTTASGEEAAAVAAALARGVQPEGRSRYETPWQTIQTVGQCGQRLEESRRIRLASLGMWPDKPHVDNHITLSFLSGPVNAPARFCLGLLHESSHLEQIREIIRQAKVTHTE